jgi:hypothetical protein
MSAPKFLLPFSSSSLPRKGTTAAQAQSTESSVSWQRGHAQDFQAWGRPPIHWTKDSGYTLAGPSREPYHHWDDEDPTGHVTELQLLLEAP